jgi:hypothetical protein
MTFREKIDRLVELIKVDTKDRYIKSNLMNILDDSQKVTAKWGKVYVNIVKGSSAFLMVEISTEIIYGHKAYGQVHKGHVYGTLDTIDEWYWGEYSPVRKSTLKNAEVRKQKVANKQLDREISKELEDLWGSREYKIQ